MRDPREFVHLATGSSSVRCGAPVSPYYRDGVWHYDGLRLDNMAAPGGIRQITCPDCKGGRRA